MNRLLSFILCLLITNISQAHNTNVTHPVMTLEAIRLIEKHDKKKEEPEYTELYRLVAGQGALSPYPFYWGKWNNNRKEDGSLDNNWPQWKQNEGVIPYDNLWFASNDENNVSNDNELGLSRKYNIFFNLNPLNVNSGVVLEDTPDSKVLNHFYNAYTGEGSNFPLTVDSRSRAMAFLKEASNIYSYESFATQNELNFEEWINLDDPKLKRPSGELYSFAKTLAYQSFGEALHHVEDMSSIAHVHSDFHLSEQARGFGRQDAVDAENDDYEALYLPNKIYQFHNAKFADREGNTSNYKDETLPLEYPGRAYTKNDLRRDGNWFLNSREEEPVEINDITQIWPNPSSQIQWAGEINPKDQKMIQPSLARMIYNASIFKADLPTPGLKESHNEASSPVPSGELTLMFPGRIKWKKLGAVGFFSFPRWTIEGLGDWHYFSNGFPNSYTNAWWPITETHGPSKNINGEDVDYYYLEQKMGIRYGLDELDSFGIPDGIVNDGVVKVDRVRKDLFKEFKEESQMERDFRGSFKMNLLEKFAHQLIPLGIKYAAGFSQYWYDHVNTPPYLKSVVVKQESINTLLPNIGENDPSSFTFTGYKARWKNYAATLCTQQKLVDRTVVCGEKSIYTQKRKLVRESLMQPLYNDRDLEIILTFNEPIKSPLTDGKYNQDSGFEIQLVPLLPFLSEEINGEQPIEDQIINIRRPAIKLNPEKIDFKSNHSEYDFEQDPDGLSFDQGVKLIKAPHLYNSIWKLIIPSSELGQDDLKGGVRLLVKAKDKNRHKTEDGRGSNLDGTPETPAKVYMALEGPLPDRKKPVFRWHDNQSSAPDEYNYTEQLPDGSFSYDDAIGDVNHLLWFNSKVSSLDDFEGQNTNSDSVSFTVVPDPD